MSAAGESRLQTLREYEPPPPAPVLSVAPFQFDPDATDAGAMNMLRMIGNVPHSTMNIARSMAELGKDPYEVGRVLLKTVAGSGEEAHRRLLGGPETENATLFRQMGRYFIDRVTNPGKTLVEDPMGALLDLIPIGAVAKLSKAGTISAKMGDMASAANPISGIPKMGTATGGKITQGLRRGAEEFSDFGTGMPRKAYHQAFNAGEAGGGRKAGFVKMIREKDAGEGLMVDFKGALQKLKTQRADDYQRRLSEIKMKSGQSQLDQMIPAYQKVRERILAKVRSFDVDISKGESGKLKVNFSRSTVANISAQRRITRVLDELMSWTDASPRGLDKLKQRIGDAYESAERFAKSNVIVTNAEQAIKSVLVEHVSGYEKLVGEYERISKHLRDFNTILSAGAKSPDAALSKMTTVLNETPVAGFRKGILTQLEELSGTPLADQIAGLTLSRIAPKNLMARGIAAGMATSATAAGASVGIPSMWFLLPLTSPRVMGEFWMALGVAKGQVNKVVRVMEEIHRKLPVGESIEALSVGTAIQKAQLAAPDSPSILFAKEKSKPVFPGLK